MDTYTFAYLFNYFKLTAREIAATSVQLFTKSHAYLNLICMTKTENWPFDFHVLNG